MQEWPNENIFTEMKGTVNYYIEEDEANYRVVRGEVDVYKFTLNTTEVESTFNTFIPQ